MTEEKLQKAKDLVAELDNKGVWLENLEEDIWKIDEDEAREDFISLLGEHTLIESDARKEGGECVYRTVYFFRDYELYLMEMLTGECHYRDVRFEAYPHTKEYFICEAVPSVMYKPILKVF